MKLNGIRLMLVLVAIGVSLSTAFAQGGPGGGGRRMGGMMGQRGGGLMLLNMPEVQKELKMTPEQIARLQEKQDEMREAAREMMQGGMSGGGQEAWQQAMANMQSLQKKAVEEVLDAGQQKRFRELELQRQGVSAIATRSDVAAELKITPDQKKQIQTLQQSQMQQMRSAMQGDFRSMTQADRAKMMEKMRDSQKAMEEKMLGVLTEDQKKRWKEMLGEPFQFPERPMGGMGFGGRGRRQGGSSE